MVPHFCRRFQFALAFLPLVMTILKSQAVGYGSVPPGAPPATIRFEPVSGRSVGRQNPFRLNVLRDQLSDTDGEDPLDVDRLDDRTLRDLLYHELGSGTEHILSTLFGNLDDDLPPASKRSDRNSKYNPGWKFIGLGKKRSFSPQVAGKPEKALFAYQWNAPVENFEVTDPYLGALALSNLDQFFNTLRDDIRKTPEVAEATSDGENFKAPSSGESSGRPKVHPRQRNNLSWWGVPPKTVYDPGWMLTGLGRR